MALSSTQLDLSLVRKNRDISLKVNYLKDKEVKDMKKLLLKRFNSDEGFMGPTHALSGVAAFLFVAAFFSEYFQRVYGPTNYPIFIAGLILTIGGSLLPDFDNTSSTAISVTGMVGQLISSAMRASARAIYAVTRKKTEPATADPHRMFWHTIVAAVGIGFLVQALISSTSLIKITLLGKVYSVGTLILAFLILIASQLMFAVFFKRFIKKVGKLIPWGIGLGISFALIATIPDGALSWVGISISLGWFIHILGDTLTTAGTPLLFPLSHKGKRWWSWRLPPYIHANGPIEHYVFIPLFLLIIGVSLIKLITG